MQDGGLENTWHIDSGYSRHMTGSSKWFSSLDPMQCKEYITFEDNSKGKVLSKWDHSAQREFCLEGYCIGFKFVFQFAFSFATPSGWL
jgi:hypothetical protein